MYKTELPKSEFRWNENNQLEQLFQIIQHNNDELRDVGLYREWKLVKVNNKIVNKNED